MGIKTPTTAEQTAINLTNFEAKLNQTSPLADQAFQRVLAGMEGLAFTTLFKFAIERALQNLVLTATKEDLDILGIEAGVIRKVAESAQHTQTIPGVNGTIIPINTDFIGDSNGVRYFSDAQVTVIGGIATINVTAAESGVVGNLQVSDTLSISTQIAGVDNQATVTVLNTIGAEEETDDAYRLRVLNALRTTLGGGNSEDYKAWSEEVAGVFRAFPYSGKPGITGSVPGERTVYIEADSTIDADGIAPAALLTDVRENIHTNPDTLKSREPLGLTDATLYVQSIIRNTFEVTITGLVVDASILTQVKSDIDDALDAYFRLITPFITGVDYEPDRNDTITNLTVSTTVQAVVAANNGTCKQVKFKLTGGSFVDTYLLDPGELAKNGTNTYD
jgi:uncharacterized phage protein gp47/JayE